MQSRDRAHLGRWFVLFFILLFCGETLGYAACLLTDSLPPRLPAWGALVVVALLVGGVATMLLEWMLLDTYRRTVGEVEELRQQAASLQQLEATLASRVEQQRRLRHDIRGLLSPVLLTADRLLNHQDPAVKRSGEIMVRTVDRATTLLADTGDAAANPPAGP